MCRGRTSQTILLPVTWTLRLQTSIQQDQGITGPGGESGQSAYPTVQGSSSSAAGSNGTGHLQALCSRDLPCQHTGFIHGPEHAALRGCLKAQTWSGRELRRQCSPRNTKQPPAVLPARSQAAVPLGRPAPGCCSGPLSVGTPQSPAASSALLRSPSWLSWTCGQGA